MESHHCLLVAIWLVVWNMNFIFHNIRDNPSHWLSYVSRWLLHHQPVMMIYIYIWWYMMVYSYYTHIILILYSYYTHIILTTFWEVAMVTILVFSFFQSHLSVSCTATPHRSAGQAGPQSARALGWGGSCCIIALWQLYGNFMGDHGDDGDPGDDGDHGHKNCYITGGIVFCLSCLLRQVYPSLRSLRSPRSLRSRRSQV